MSEDTPQPRAPPAVRPPAAGAHARAPRPVCPHSRSPRLAYQHWHDETL